MIYFQKMLKQVSKLYQLEEAYIADILVNVISEVVTSSFGFDVVASKSDDFNIILVAYIKQHGIVNSFDISLNKIDRRLRNKIMKEFQLQLDMSESNNMFELYKKFKDTLVSGYVDSFKNGEYQVTIDGLDAKNNIIAVCHRYNVLAKEWQNIVGKRCIFYATNIQSDNVMGRIRLRIVLSRRTKLLPLYFIQKIVNSEDLKIKCIYRKPGVITYLKSNKKIDKNILNLLSQELNGEAIIVKPLEVKQ